MYGHNLKKPFSVFLAGVFFLTQGANAAEIKNFWEQRRGAQGRFQAASSKGLWVGLPASGGLSAQATVSRTFPPLLPGPWEAFEKWVSPLLPYGFVQDAYLSPEAGAPLIIHLQDVHGAAEAQAHISKMIQALSSAAPGPALLVGVEGANFDVLRQVARRNAPVRLKDVGH